MIDIQQQQTTQRAAYVHAAIPTPAAATATGTASTTVSNAEVQRSDGDPVNYYNFICFFENLIEAKTKSSSTKLY